MEGGRSAASNFEGGGERRLQAGIEESRLLQVARGGPMLQALTDRGQWLQVGTDPDSGRRLEVAENDATLGDQTRLECSQWE